LNWRRAARGAGARFSRTLTPHTILLLGFLRAACRFAQGRAINPTDMLVRAGLGNAEALSKGWPDFDPNHQDFPSADPRPTDRAALQ